MKREEKRREREKYTESIRKKKKNWKNKEDDFSLFEKISTNW